MFGSSNSPPLSHFSLNAQITIKVAKFKIPIDTCFSSTGWNTRDIQAFIFKDAKHVNIDRELSI